MTAPRKLRTNGTSKTETTTLRIRKGDTPDERARALFILLDIYGPAHACAALAEALRAKGVLLERCAETTDSPDDAAFFKGMAAPFILAAELTTHAADAESLIAAKTRIIKIRSE